MILQEDLVYSLGIQGDDYNLVSDNGFNGNDYGASAWGKNNVEYLANCF